MRWLLLVCVLGFTQQAWAQPVGFSAFNIESGASSFEYLRGKQYTGPRSIVASLGPMTGWFAWFAGDRITVQLDPNIRPLRVIIQVGAMSSSFDVSADAPCTRPYAGCTTHPGPSFMNTSFDNLWVVQSGGAYEIDLIPNGATGVAGGDLISVSVEFEVLATATLGATAVHGLQIFNVNEGFNGSGQYQTSAPSLPHTIANVIAQTFTVTASPSPIIRPQSATVTLAATDQNGDAIADLSAVVVTLDERLGSPAGTVLPVAERGALSPASANTRTYVPSATPQAQTIAASFSATIDSLSPAPALVEVQRGAIASFALSPSSDVVMPGATRQFVPITPLNSAGGAERLAANEVTWSVSSGASIDASGNVQTTQDWRDADQVITVTAQKDTATANATLTVTPTVVASCDFALTPNAIALAESTVASVVAIGPSGQTRDYTSLATLSWSPQDALEQQGSTLLAKRAGVEVQVNAALSVCPNGPLVRTLSIRAPQAGDLASLELAPLPTLIVGGTANVTATAVFVGGARQEITPETWTLGPGLEFVASGKRETRVVRATTPGASFVRIAYRGLEATASLQVDAQSFVQLSWRLKKQTVRQGEPIPAHLVVTADASGQHDAVVVSAVIPSGLALIGGVTTWTLAIPSGTSEQVLEVPLMARAQSGVWPLLATANEGTQQLAASPPGIVRITADPEFSEALLVGRVFDDKNKNGRADDDEPGIGGVTIGLSAGLFVTTDANGNYHVPALPAESIVAKIDLTTLPHLAPLTTRERISLVLTPGQIFRADFGVDLSEPRPPLLVQDKTRSPRIVKTIDGLAYQLPVVFTHAPSDTPKTEPRLVTVPLEAVRNEVVVSASGDNGTTGHYKVVVRRYGNSFVIDPPALVKVDYPAKPDSTHFLVALGEGLIGFEPRPGSNFGLHWDGRVAFAYRGRIKGKFLIDAGADTSLKDVPNFFQRDARRIFRNLDPESYYPVYGDASQLIDERESGQRLYVRVEAGPLMAKYGGFRTGLTQNQYGRYDRALVGVAGRFLLDRATGDAHKVFVFYAKPESQRVHDDLYVTGSSLYYLSQKSVVEGSEQIWLETRQARTGIQRERRQLVPGADYQIDYIAGRILLERAMGSSAVSSSLLRQSAADGDERWLQVDYEVAAGAVGGQGDVIGGRVSERPMKGLELGATGVTELRAGGNNYWLAGGDVNVNLWQPLSFHVEYAHSERTLQSRALSYDGGLSFAALPDASNEVRGDAVLGRLALDYKDFKAEAYGRYRSFGFNDTTNAPGERVTQFGGTARSPTFHGFQAALTIDDLRREATYATVPVVLPSGGLRLGRQTSEIELKQDVGPVTLLVGARYAQVAPGFGVGREVVVGGGVIWRILPRLAIGATHQQPVYRDGDRVFDSYGRDTQLLTRFVVGNGLEVEGAVGYGERGFSGRATATAPLSPDTKLTAGLVYGGTTIAEGFSLGLRRKTADGTLMYVDNQYQKTNLLGGAVLNAKNSVQQPSIETHVGGVEMRLFGAHALSVSGEAGKRNPGGGFDALIERYGAGVGHSYAHARFTLRSRIEARFDTVSSAVSVAQVSTAPSQRTLAGFIRGDIKATETLSLAAWFKGSASVALQPGDPPLAEMAEAAIGFAYRPNAMFKPMLFGRYAYTHDRLPAAQNPDATVTDAHILALTFTFDPWKYTGLYGKVAGKAGSLRIGTLGAASLLSVMAIPRLNVHLTSIFDVSAEYRLCHDQGVGTRHGMLAEASVLIGDFVRLGAGYNLSDIGEGTVDCNAQSVRGIFIRAQAFY